MTLHQPAFKIYAQGTFACSGLKLDFETRVSRSEQAEDFVLAEFNGDSASELAVGTNIHIGIAP